MSLTWTAPEVLNPDLDPDDPIHSHIIKGHADAGGKDAETLVMEARVYGTPVTALCGYVWVPSRDPQRHPVCSKCLDVLKGQQGLN